MPRMFVSVALLFVLIVVSILSAGVWAGRAKRQWIQSQQQPVLPFERLKAQRAASEARAWRLRTIEVNDHTAKTYPAQAEMLHRMSNDLRQELGLPPKQYPEHDASSIGTPHELAADVMPASAGSPLPADKPQRREIPRLPERPPWLRFDPQHAGLNEGGSP